LTPFIIDLSYYSSGGICKVTDLKITSSYSRHSQTYTIVAITDTDGKIYLASGMPKTSFLSRNAINNNVRITYLPCTRKVIKLEVKISPIDLFDFGNMSSDGYLEVYNYSKDTLPAIIAVIGLLLICCCDLPDTHEQK
jgi:hypothetical protein